MKRLIREKRKASKKYYKRKQNFPFFLTKFFKISIIIILIIICFNIAFVFIYHKNSLVISEEFIKESKNYKNFDEIKNKVTDIFTDKILKNISIIKHIFSKNIESDKRNKKLIHITSSIDNVKNYNYILYVSMHSLLTNCNKNETFIVYHILCTPDFNEASITIFKTLFNNFSHNIEMIFYNMGNHFLKNKSLYLSQATFYRLLSPLLIDSDRIIYLDGDTLIFSDLYEMYNLDFNDNYVLGFYDILSDGLDYLGLKSNIYINAGVLLFNLKKMKEDNKTFEIINFINSNPELRKGDQTIINYLLHPKIGRLPSKFGIWNFEDKSDIIVYLNKIRTKVPIDELEEALKNPVIMHIVLCLSKPWSPDTSYISQYTNCRQRNSCSCKKYFDLWHSFANKTEYYEEIKNFTIRKL